MSGFVYRHAQPFVALWLGLTLGAIGSTLGIAASDDADATLGIVIALSSFALALLLFGRLVIELHSDRLHWHLGFVGWPRWNVRLSNIAGMERTRAAPWLDAGIRGRTRDRLYNVSIGGTALKLTLTDGRSITLGTPEPDRLAGFLEPRLSRRR